MRYSREIQLRALVDIFIYTACDQLVPVGKDIEEYFESLEEATEFVNDLQSNLWLQHTTNTSILLVIAYEIAHCFICWMSYLDDCPHYGINWEHSPFITYLRLLMTVNKSSEEKCLLARQLISALANTPTPDRHSIDTNSFL